MKEFDLDSYCRKWRQTHGIWVSNNETKEQGYFQEFFEITKGILGMEVVMPSGKERKVSLDKPVDTYETGRIEYYPIHCGWYPHRHGAALLIRKHSRGFSQGLSNNNHDLFVYNQKGEDVSGAVGRFSYCDFLNRPAYEKLNPSKSFGVMSDRVWWKDGSINFLLRAIGYYKGNKVCLESKAFHPYIKPLLGEQCQIS